MRKAFCLLVPMVFALCGCLVTSFYPFYNEKDVSFDSNLLGSWLETDSDNHWEFAPRGTNAYKLTYSNKDSGVSLIEVRLFKVEGHTFLDFFGAKMDENLLPPPIPSHFPLKVIELRTNSVRLAAMDYDWLTKQLEENPKFIKHAVLSAPDSDDKRVVLAAETPELQKLLLKAYGATNAWKEVELRRP
jgi:hypothetical protein